MLKQEELIQKVRTYNPFLNPEALTKAYAFALNAHKNQKRDSGDPYLVHPVAVADLVDGVTKISELEGKIIENSKAENIRKLILATSKDIRVLLVKLADRLHNMRTLNSIVNADRKKRIAQETMEIFAPLADRMGMNHIRDELEDLSFLNLNPKARDLVVQKLSLNKDKRNNLRAYLSNLRKQMYKEAESLNFEKAAKLRDEISNLEKNELSVK